MVSLRVEEVRRVRWSCTAGRVSAVLPFQHHHRLGARFHRGARWQPGCSCEYLLLGCADADYRCVGPQTPRYQSEWVDAYYLYPLITGLAWLVFMVQDGQPGKNQHGLNPKNAAKQGFLENRIEEPKSYKVQRSLLCISSFQIEISDKK